MAILLPDLMRSRVRGKSSNMAENFVCGRQGAELLRQGEGGLRRDSGCRADLGGEPVCHSARDTAGRRRQNSQKNWKNCCGEMRDKTRPSVLTISLRAPNSRWRNADEPWRCTTDPRPEEILEAPRGSGGLRTIPGFLLPGSRENLCELPADEKKSAQPWGEGFPKMLGIFPTML